MGGTRGSGGDSPGNAALAGLRFEALHKRWSLSSPSTFPVYSAMSNETLTWLMAPRLYTSVGRTAVMIFTKQVESVRSP